jgi:hypothetical protein
VVKAGPDQEPSKVPASFVDFQLKAAVEVVEAALAKRAPKVDRRELSSLKKPETPK